MVDQPMGFLKRLGELTVSEQVFVRMNWAVDTCAATRLLESGGANPAEDVPEAVESPIQGEDGDPNEIPDSSGFPLVAAPSSLGTASLPDDPDLISELFERLPAELFGAARVDDRGEPGDLSSSFGVTGPVGCGQVGVQAMNVSVGGETAEQFVAGFASAADWEVEEFGRDGAMFWVLWNTTCRNADDAAEDTIFVATWGTEGSSWAVDPPERDDSSARNGGLEQEPTQRLT